MAVKPPAGFEWDCEKYERNMRAHEGLKFDEAMFAFKDANALDYESRWEDGEARWSILGMVLGRLLHVSYTERDGGRVTRIISARKATRKERDAYFTR